jgi:uncharacterized repeat protein (TIGR01451 family)
MSTMLGRGAAVVAALVVAFTALAGRARAQSTPAGTVIKNRVQVRYVEPEGGVVTTESPVVTVVVTAVNGVTVTPKETEPNGFIESNTEVTAHFSICNTGNQTSSYLVTGATVSAPSQIEGVHFDLDSSGTVTAGDVTVAFDSTPTPALAPGACQPALVVYQSGAAPSGSQAVVTLTARVADETAGKASDTGTVRRTVKERPRFTDPTDPNLPPLKTVNGVVEVVASPSQAVKFEIAFRNSGETTASGVRVLDQLPEGLTFVAGSLRLTTLNQTVALTDAADSDAGDVSGQTVQVRLPSVAQDQIVRLDFSARVDSQPSGTVLINRATVSADNAPQATTRDVRVIVSPQGKVFDGDGGQSSPVKATLRVLSSSSQGPLLGLPSGTGFVPNEPNVNPYSTSADGMYSFRITPPAQADTYFLLCDAGGYKPRVIQVSVTPQDGVRYGVTLTALDGQPLAVANGFSLTGAAVSFSALGAFAWNVPMFSTGGVEITKTADRAAAEIGDVVSYRVEVRNTLRQPARGVVVTDTLPQSFYYVPGTALLTSGTSTRQVEPSISGDVITFRLPDIPAGSTATLSYRVRIGVNARLGQQFNVAVACRAGVCTPPARVPVVVRGGVFSNDQLLVGRVFIDANRDGLFDAGDKPVAGARLYTPNGFTVITDAAGNYSFPVLAGGALSVGLDRSTVPAGYVPRDTTRGDGSRWSRLVTTPLQRGALLQTVFPLVAESDASAAPELPAATAAAGKPAAAPNGSAPAVEVARQKKRSFWSRLAFWRRDSPRPSSVTTTVIVPATPAPPCAPTSPSPAAVNPAPVRVEVTAPPTTNNVAPVVAPSVPATKSAPAMNTAPASNGVTPLSTQTRPAPSATPSPSPSPVVLPAAQSSMPSAPAQSAPGFSASQPVRSRTTQAMYVPPAVAAVVDSPAPVAPVAAAAPRPTPGSPRPAPVVASPAVTPAVAGANVAGVNKVEPGSVEVDVTPQTLISTPGFDVPVRVALGYQPRLFLNGVEVDSSRIGERREDHTTDTQQVTYVGLTPAPGPNKLRAVAVGPDGVERASREVTVFGRGPAVRLVVEPERAEISAGRRDKTGVVIKAFDAWGNPALDGDVAVQTSAGSFDGPQEAASLEVARAEATATQGGQPGLVARPSQLQNQRTVQLVGGTARVQLVAADSPGSARVLVSSGASSAQADVRFVTEADAPRVVVGIANVTVGRAAPVMDLRQVDEPARGSLAFFFKGRLWSDHVLTLSYDSQRPLQRLDARDRLFQVDPLERTYSVFGDSSTRFSSAASNSKLYARLDFGRAWGHSFAMFGDFTPDTRNVELAAYNRKLTGVQVQFENSRGDYVSVGGARPDTSFGRDVFPAGVLGFVRLSAALILPGSETVTLEVRDRRNPDVVIRRESLQRGADYNLDADTGQLFFIRQLQSFDSALDLVQVVVTYEYQGQNSSTNVYTLRASRRFGERGPRVGLTANYQRQGSLGNFFLGGFDLTQRTPRGGEFKFEFARSSGHASGAGNFFSSLTTDRGDGDAFALTYDQPLAWRDAKLQLNFRRATQNFLNPFGGTIVGGAQRAGVSLDLRASASSRLRLGFTDERNDTELVRNNRQTAGFTWTQEFGDKFTGSLAYDFRSLHDSSGGKTRDVTSNMVTVGLDWRPSDRAEFSVRREQNLGEADPTFPTQTVLSGSYRLNAASRLFVTQRLSNAPILPISDTSGAGFSFSQSRREFNAGVETKLLRDTSITGGYRIEQGQDGNDGFAVIGLTQTWKLRETFALDAGYERAIHMTGKDARGGYNNLSFGATWNPRTNFVANSRYQYRDRDGSGHLFTAGFAGKPFANVTALGQIQFARGSSFGATAGASPGPGVSAQPSAGQATSGFYGSFGVAVRPVKSDRVAAFFNYQHRSLTQGAGPLGTSERSDTFSADAFVQALRRVALFGKFAMRGADSSRPGVPAAPTLTYLVQGRAEYRLSRQFDFALEARYIAQPSTHTSREGVAGELGYWVTPDVRFGLGYNFNRALEQPGRDALGGDRRGFYFSVTTKLERVFDFFDAQKKKKD